MYECIIRQKEHLWRGLVPVSQVSLITFHNSATKLLPYSLFSSPFSQRLGQLTIIFLNCLTSNSSKVKVSSFLICDFIRGVCVYECIIPPTEPHRASPVPVRQVSALKLLLLLSYFIFLSFPLVPHTGHFPISPPK